MRRVHIFSSHGGKSRSFRSEDVSCADILEQTEPLASLAHMLHLKRLARPLQRFQPLVSSSNHKLFVQRPTYRTHNLSTSTTSRASLASSLPTQPTVVLYHPNHAELEKEELEVDLLPPEQVKIDITDRAAAVCRFCTP